MTKWKTEDSAPNNKKRTLNPICSKFQNDFNFDRLGFEPWWTGTEHVEPAALAK
jgi:hypothetical protein